MMRSNLNTELTTLLDAYADSLTARGYAESTRRHYQGAVRRFLMSLGTEAGLDDITHPAMQAYVSQFQIAIEDLINAYGPDATREEVDAINAVTRTQFGRQSVALLALKTFGEFLQRSGQKVSDPAFGLEPITADHPLASPERKARHIERMRSVGRKAVLSLPGEE